MAVPYLFVNEELPELDLLPEVVVLADSEAAVFGTAAADVGALVEAVAAFVDVPPPLEQAISEIVITATSSTVSAFFMFISPS